MSPGGPRKYDPELLKINRYVAGWVRLPFNVTGPRVTRFVRGRSPYFSSHTRAGMGRIYFPMVGPVSEQLTLMQFEMFR